MFDNDTVPNMVKLTCKRVRYQNWLALLLYIPITLMVVSALITTVLIFGYGKQVTTYNYILAFWSTIVAMCIFFYGNMERYSRSHAAGLLAEDLLTMLMLRSLHETRQISPIFNHTLDDEGTIHVSICPPDRGIFEVGKNINQFQRRYSSLFSLRNTRIPRLSMLKIGYTFTPEDVENITSDLATRPEMITVYRLILDLIAINNHIPPSRRKDMSCATPPTAKTKLKRLAMRARKKMA